MTIDRTYPATWGNSEVLTSAQMNAVDTALTYALDRRAGQIDVLMSIVVATGTGRIISSIQTGPDASATISVGDGSVVLVPTLTAARAYTVSATGATGGDRLIAFASASGVGASGWVDIRSSVGTGLARLAANGDTVELVHRAGEWQLLRQDGAPRVLEFTSTGSFVCPPGISELLADGYGGGGGGGPGASTFTTPAGVGVLLPPGGGGGGGSLRTTRRVRVVPGQEYTVTVGAGGAPGSDGADTTIADPSTTVALFGGASRGMAGVGATGASYDGTTFTCAATGVCGVLVFGGSNTKTSFVTTGTSASPSGPSSIATGSVFGVPTNMRIRFEFDHLPFRGPQGAGSGGPGASFNFPEALMRHGWGSAEGYAGGTAGPYGGRTTAVAAFSQANGGGGGGGGAGPGGVGGQGGTGGSAAIGSNTDGVPGTSPAANSGAGGGGGGSAGWSQNTAAAAGGAGGAGGSGKLTVVLLK